MTAHLNIFNSSSRPPRKFPISPRYIALSIACPKKQFPSSDFLFSSALLFSPPPSPPYVLSAYADTYVSLAPSKLAPCFFHVTYVLLVFTAQSRKRLSRAR